MRGLDSSARMKFGTEMANSQATMTTTDTLQGQILPSILHDGKDFTKADGEWIWK